MDICTQQYYFFHYGLTFYFIGLGFRIYDILNGNYDSKEDPKTLMLLGSWAIGFTILWIAIGGFGSNDFAPYKGWWFVD